MDITRNCPCCQELIFYKKRKNKERFEKSLSICRKCLTKKNNNKNKGFSLTRRCPSCQSEINYISKNGFNAAEKNNSKCRDCVFTEERKKQYSEMFSGENGAFYGKHHTAESKEKLRLANIGRKHTEESKKKISQNSRLNPPMKGKSVYSLWVKRYGKEEADKKIIKLREKQRQNSTGEKNPMYGKPPPNGVGNGYSGWYNGLFFRSLKELMFIVKYLERFNLTYESLEKRKSKIKYFDEYSKTYRNYFGDYLVNGRYFVEIKPKKLWNTPLNSQKFSAAKEFCKNNNLIFKLIDPKIDTSLIFKLFDDNKIKFMDRYLLKFIKWREKYDNTRNS